MNRIRRQRGSALVLVLWVMVLMIVMAASFSVSMRREALLARNLVEAAQARQLAAGGVRHAMLGLQAADPDIHWPADGVPRRLEFGAAEVWVAVGYESGKVDLNTAPDGLLDALLATLDVPEAERPPLIDALADWRDADHDRRLHGAERDDYRAAGLPYGPRNGPFETVDELGMVPGFRGPLYRRMAPLITVHSGQPGVDPRYAPRALLRTLSGLEDAELDAWDEQRRLAAEQGLEPPPFPGQGVHLAAQGGLAYSIASLARLPGGTEAGLHAIARQPDGWTVTTFSVLAWKENIPVEIMRHDHIPTDRP